MATITTKQVGPDNTGVITFLWETITSTNSDGQAVRVPSHTDKTVQVTGTFNGATLTLQGSNDGTTWADLTDQAGSDLDFTAAGLAVIAENPIWIRPAQTNGSLTDVDVFLVCAPRNR